MGVNKICFAIKNDKDVIKASNNEIIRRYYQTLKNNFLGKCSDSLVEKAKKVLQKANLNLKKLNILMFVYKRQKNIKLIVLF